MAAIITEFVLDEFQDGNPLKVLDLGNGLNVALVGSEGDRARMLQVVPWTFYGPGGYFTRSSTRTESTPPGRLGVAVLSTDHGVFHVERDWADATAIPHLTDNDGQAFEPAYLEELLDRVPPKTFREVFTFELARMARMVRHPSYGLERLPRLTKYLKDKSPQLEDQHPNRRLDLRGFQSQLDELKQRIAHAVTGSDTPVPTSGDQEKLRRELSKLDSDISDGRNKLKQLHTEMDAAQCALATNRLQLRLQDVQRELDELNDGKSSKGAIKVNAEVAARLEDKVRSAKLELSDIKDEADELRRQGKALGNLSRLNQLMPQIEALLMQENSLLKEDAGAEQLELQIRDLEARIESERLQATTRTIDRSPAMNVPSQDSHAVARIDGLAQQMRDADRDLQLAEERLTRAESSNSMARENLARASALAAHPEDAVAFHEAERRVARLQELLGLDEQLQRMQDQRDDLDSQVRRLYARQMMPFQATMALGIPFVLGISMILWGLLMNHPANWRMISLGFLTSIATALFKMNYDRETTGRLHSARRRLSHLNLKIDEIASAREESAMTGVSLSRQLEDAVRDLEQLQMQFEARETHMVSPVGDASRKGVDVEATRGQLAQTQHRHQELDHLWRELMIELNLSPNMTPDHAREAIASRAFHDATAPAAIASGPSMVEQLQFQLAQMRQDLDRRRDWLSVIAGQARQLVSELGTSYGGSNLPEQLQILRQSFDEHRNNMQTRRNLLRSIKRLKQKAGRIKDAGRRYADQRRKLDDEVQWKNDQRKKQTKQRTDRIQLLEQQRADIQNELRELQDRYGVAGDVELASQDDNELESRFEALNAKLSKLQDRLIKQSEQRGRCRAQLNLSAQDAPDAAPVDHWNHILEQTEQVAAGFEGLARDAALLPNRTERYQYLEEASGYLNQLTYGQYVEIDTPADGQITLIDREGHAHDFREVRREHYANIYFSLWMARINAYANRGLRLPIVMEDPLEATPAERKLEVAKMLRDFAVRGHHQVILVTSDPRNADTFAQLDVPIADLWNQVEVIESVSPIATIDAPIQQLENLDVEALHYQPTEPTPEFRQESPTPVSSGAPREPLFPPIS